MFDNLLATGFLTFGAAALVVPASRRWLLGSVDYDWLGDELEFDCIAPDGASVVLKDGSVFEVWELAGTPYETKPEEQQVNLCEQRSNLFKMMVAAKVTLRLFGVKRKRDVSFQAAWPSRALQEIGEAEAASNREAYDLRWFVILQAKQTKDLNQVRAETAATLSFYQGRRLERPAEALSPCPLTAFLNYLACGDLRDDLPAIAQGISGNLPACDLHYSQTGLIKTFTPTQRLHRILAIKLWPETLSGEMIGLIMALPFDLEIFQIVKPMDQGQKKAALLLQEVQATAPFIGNEKAASEFKMAGDDISSGMNAYGETQFQLSVRAKTEGQLEEALEQLARILSRHQVQYSIESSRAAIAEWFNRLPGHEKKLTRPLTLTNHNVAALWPFAYSPKGLTQTAICENPVRLLKTPLGGAYSFQFQCSARPQALGNFLVFAPSGSGKTTLVLHLLSGLAQNDTFRSFIFDSYEGTRAMVESFGGAYRSYDQLAFNPFDSPDTPQNRQVLKQVLRAMIGAGLTEEMDEELDHVIEIGLGLKEATLNSIFDVAFKAGSPLQKAFAKWTINTKGKAGHYSHVFNAGQDDLKGYLSQSFITGINMNEALGDEWLGPPVVTHIAGAIVQLSGVSGAPYGIFIDEAANLLRNEAFRKDFATVMYREVRKRDGFIGMAFQEPAALTAFPKEAEAILSNTATFVFFPSAGYQESALGVFGLNEEQANFVMGRTPLAGERRVLILKRDAATGHEESAIVNVDLSDLGDALRFYGSGPAANRRVDALKEQWGAQWREYL